MSKIYYITDNRENFIQGNYYQCYINGFSKIENCEIKYLEENITELNCDVIIIGHGLMAVFIGNKYTNILNLIRKSRAKKILFTRNDYGNRINQQQNIINEIKPDLTVVNTRNSLRAYKNTILKWMPFGIDNRFINKNLDRPIDIGFRGNLNNKWNKGERGKFIQLINTLSKNYTIDIQTSNNGEKFLLGIKYIDWLNSCKLIINTISASETVGPKFIEAMSCGCAIIAPPNKYEGLFIEDINYMCIKNQPDLCKIDMYIANDIYRQSFLDANFKFVSENNTLVQAKEILNLL